MQDSQRARARLGNHRELVQQPHHRLDRRATRHSERLRDVVIAPRLEATVETEPQHCKPVRC
eukprot:7343004-Prymnesium_polylepis.1